MKSDTSERKMTDSYEGKPAPKFNLIVPLDENLIRTLKADSSTPRGEIINLIKEYICRRGKKCSLCGKRCYRQDLIIDRRKPISHGGKDNIENLQLLCQKCSELKGNNTMLQIRKKIRAEKHNK